MNFLFVARSMTVMNCTKVGGGIRSTMMIEALSKLGHVDVISFVKEPVESNLPNCNVVFSGETSKRKITLQDWLLLNLHLFFTPWSPKGYYHINKEQEKIISRYYNEKHYDYIVCHFMWDAIPCGLIKYADRLIIDVDDNLVSVQKRNWASVRDKRMSLGIKAMWKTLMVGTMQKRLLKRVKLSFYSNSSEPPFEKSVFLHNVPLLSSPCSDITESTPMRILFVGNIDFFPNRNGILHFVESVFPIIKKRMPMVEVNIVGLISDQKVKSRLCSQDGVNVLGFVENLQEEYQNCRAVIVPLYHGAGTSIKFIEGIMMNRPIVSTQTGARGFDSIFQANQHYLSANSDQEFADSVVEVLSDIDKAVLMTHEAYEIGKVHFSKSSFFDVVTKAIENIKE